MNKVIHSLRFLIIAVTTTRINRNHVGDAALGVLRAVEDDRPYRSFTVFHRILHAWAKWLLSQPFSLILHSGIVQLGAKLRGRHIAVCQFREKV